MNRRSLGDLRAEFPGTSWAAWSEEFPNEGCIEDDPECLTEFIESKCRQLNARVVILDASRSPTKLPGYRKFHSPSTEVPDQLLKSAIQEQGLTNISGAFMTELSPALAASDGSQLAPDELDVKHFWQQIRALGYFEFHIICLSALAFDALRPNVGQSVDSLEYGIRTVSGSLDEIDVQIYQLSEQPTASGIVDTESIHQRFRYLDETVIE